MDKNRYEDVEISQEATPDVVWVTEESDQASQEGGKVFGVVALLLSALGFFYAGYFLAPAGIILGVIGVKKGSSLGWWAIVLGVIALVISIVFGMIMLPFKLFS